MTETLKCPYCGTAHSVRGLLGKPWMRADCPCGMALLLMWKAVPGDPVEFWLEVKKADELAIEGLRALPPPEVLKAVAAPRDSPGGALLHKPPRTDSL